MSVFRGSGILKGALLAAGLVAASRATATVAVAPTSASLFPTQNVAVTATVSTTLRAGLPVGTHTLSVTGMPLGVATQPAIVTYTVNGPFIFSMAVPFQFFVGLGAVAGTYPITISDTTPGVGGSAVFSLTILEPQLRLAIQTPVITLGAASIGVPVAVSSDPGFSPRGVVGIAFIPGTVSLVFGVDAGQPPANVTAGGQQVIRVYNTRLTFPFSRTGLVVPGTYPEVLTASWVGTTGALLSATASLTLNIPDIGVAVGALPATSVCNGGIGVPSANVTYTPLFAYQGAPSVAAISAPTGVTVAPPVLPGLPPAQTAPFALAAVGAPPGVQTFTAHVFDASMVIDRAFTVPFQVINPDVTPLASPSVLSLQAGGPAQPFSVSATPPPPQCNASIPVVVTLVGLPSGFIVPAPVTLQPPGYGAQPLAVSAAASVAAGTYPATLHFAPANLPAKDLPVSIQVSAAPVPPDFVLTAVPSSLTLVPGGSGKITFTVTPQGGFNAPVTLTVPPNGSISASPSPYTFPAAGGSVDVTFTAAPNATAATVPVTVSAAGGGGVTVSHTVSVTVVVQPPAADFNVRVTPPAPSVPAGRSVPLSFTLDAIGSFTGSATVTPVSLPANATLTPATLLLLPGVPQTATLAIPRATAPGTYTLVFRADEAASAVRRAAAISKTVNVPLVVQPAIAGFTVTVSPTAALASPDQAVAVRYTFQNLGDAPITITGDTFARRAGGTVFDTTEETVGVTLPARGTAVVSNTVLVKGEQFAKAGTPPIVFADRVFRAAPDASGFVDSAGATVTVTAANSLLSTASVTRISIVYPPSGTLVGRGNSLRAQGLLIGSGTGNLLVGWFFDGVLVETATVPLQNGTPTSVSSAVTLPTLVSGNHDITLSVLAPNTLSSPVVQIYVDEGQQTLRLVSPSAGAVLAPAFGVPTFSWIPVPGIARYGVGLRQRAPGARWRWTFTVDTRWSPPASLWNGLPEGEYEWGVRGYTGTSRVFLDSQSGGASAPSTSEGSLDLAEGWTVSSAQGRFSIGAAAGGALPDLEGQATLGDAGLRFAWKEIPGALYVHVLYEQAPEGLRRVRTEIATKPSLLIPTAALPRGGPFVWRVTALDKEGRPLGTTAAAPVPAAGGSR